MTTLDKVIILTSTDYVKNLNYDYFKITTNPKSGFIEKEEYISKQPYTLHLKLDHKFNELIIEFSSKILADNYYNLINLYNFKDCLYRINNSGICELDVEKIYSEGLISGCETTIDVRYPYGVDHLTKNISLSLANFKKYTVDIINGNCIITKKVTTGKSKRRITIYDKFKEISMAKNKEFINSLRDKEKLLADSAEKIRLEERMKGKERIRKAFNVADNKIKTILTAEANPIRDLISTIFVDDDIFGRRPLTMTKREHGRWAELRAYDFDLKRLEDALRIYCSPTTKMADVMKPYRQLLHLLNEDSATPIKQTLLDLIDEASSKG